MQGVERVQLLGSGGLGEHSRQPADERLGLGRRAERRAAPVRSSRRRAPSSTGSPSCGCRRRPRAGSWSAAARMPPCTGWHSALRVSARARTTAARGRRARAASRPSRASPALGALAASASAGGVARQCPSVPQRSSSTTSPPDGSMVAVAVSCWPSTWISHVDARRAQHHRLRGPGDPHAERSSGSSGSTASVTGTPAEVRARREHEPGGGAPGQHAHQLGSRAAPGWSPRRADCGRGSR